MFLRLQVDGAIHQVEVDDQGITIGRGDNATIRVAANSVSRVHARFFYKDGEFYIQDLKSLNGTTLNGRALSDQALPLQVGDTAMLGDVVVRRIGEIQTTPVRPMPSSPSASPATSTDRGFPSSNMEIARRTLGVSMEDRAFDASGSILVPHASLEKLLAQQEIQKNVPTLFQRLATMAGTLLKVASLKDLLDAVMALVTGQILCQRGFILLLGPEGELIPEVIWEERPGTNTQPISRTIARTAISDKVTILTTDARMDPRFSAGESIKIHGITSALCAPMIADDQPVGVIYLESSLARGGFKREDEHLLSAMANFAALGIQREREARFRQRLERYHSPQVVNEIMKAAQSAEAPALQAQRREISVLFADISGFTRLSEGMEPLHLASVLNRVFEALTEQIFIRGGTLDKFIGDAIMAFFGAPNPDELHAIHAVEAAIGMQQALSALNAVRPDGYPELTMRIGINSGPAFAGDIGCEKRMDYTVMGTTVNLASRFESSIAKPGQIAISANTAGYLDPKNLRCLGSFNVKGIDHSIEAYEVIYSLN